MSYSAVSHGRIASLCIVLIAAFAVLFVLAMLFYPGGTASDPSREGYSFTRNFFSDTGRTRSFSGARNSLSMTLFGFALISVNIGLFLFHGANFLMYRASSKPWNYLACFSGMASALAAMLIPFFPDDLLPAPHLAVTLAFSNLLLISLLGYAVVVLRDGGVRKFHGRLIIAYVAYLVLYMIVVMVDFGMDRSTLEILQATGQKVAIIAGFSCLFSLAFGIKGKLKSLPGPGAGPVAERE